MPTMANIVVQNAAAANVTYTAVTPSAGDRSPARWNETAASAIIGHRPQLNVVTRDNGNGSGRHFEATYRAPITGTVDGQVVILATVPFTLSGTLPMNVDSTLVNDACVKMSNLFASTLIRSVFSEGYAPT